MQNQRQYYEKVAGHFDEDARLFEKRYLENPVLQKIRGEFRKHTEQLQFTNALEIGTGPGMDLCYFARKYPGKMIRGIDISQEMVNTAVRNIAEAGLENAIARTGSVEDIPHLFPEARFDLVYVYFGGLNTVYDLKQTVRLLHQLTATGAYLVLTFVNRYYIMDFLYRSVKLRFSDATARFRNRWKGYSPGRALPGRVYSARTIRNTFHPEFGIMSKRGYSLLYPPWYAARHLQRIRILEPALWKLDAALQKTPLWNIGEYSLYVMQRR